jgi:outer membrane protein assembly factor BamB
VTRVAAIAVFAVLAASCRTISLSSNALMPEPDAHVSPPAYFDVQWWNTLVKPTLLEYQPSETATPAIDPDTERIVVCTRDSMLRSLSPIDGRIEWEKPLHGRCFAGSTIEEGVIYVPGGDSTLYALRARTGEELWKYESGEELVTSPVLSGDTVLVASQSETLFAVDRNTGKWKWQYRRDPPPGFTVRGTATPVVRNDIVYMGFADGYVVALGLSDGAQKWERNLTTSGGTQFLDADATPVLDDNGNLFAASYKDGVYQLKAETGDLEWTTARQGAASVLRAGDEIIVSGEGKLQALFAGTGKEMWSLELNQGQHKSALFGGGASTAGRPPLLLRGILVVPTTGPLVFVDPMKGRAKMSWNPGKGVTATPALSHGRLYVLTNLGTVFALQLRGGGS